mmetsp:Transcript_100856/g.289913  ORF Transcript_100856/g.289913 Transcript_100856/m.289913 type:complete len:642 (-) Transcript_100856:419-2344(-)
MAREIASAERPQFAHKIELLLTLVGYAVGFGNIWRFPYLTYAYGGGAFLIPYVLSLLCLGLPLFMLELGLGQMTRQGTLGVWSHLGLPRFRGVGIAATMCTFFVTLYYNVIIAWTVYYLGRTIGSLATGGGLPWDAMGLDGAQPCPVSTVIVPAEMAGNPSLFDAATGLFNQSHAADFWCPAGGVPDASTVPPIGFVPLTTRARHCPGAAALHFWQDEVLQQSSGLTDFGGIHEGMLAAYTVAWLLTYFCIFNGVHTSGKVVYVTATLPYIALAAFFVRAVTLPNAGQGAKFFITPDFEHLRDGQVWIRAVTQIFYSLGVGFGSLVAFSSYNERSSNFVRDAVEVSLINCGTSIFAGFVVFPIMGYLAHELSQVNPCISSDDLSGLSSVGLSGTGLAFIAFPIAIARMPGGFFWALLFFVMLLSLGIDSQFAMIESIVTVCADAGLDKRLRRPVLAGIVCLVEFCIGLVFVTRGGIYWFRLFDNYSCLIALFFVAAMEAIGLTWSDANLWAAFKRRVTEWTGIRLGMAFLVSWKFVCPLLIIAVAALSLKSWDVMDARRSRPFPEGTGAFPVWSIWFGWAMALLPVLVALLSTLLPGASSAQWRGRPFEDHGSSTSEQGDGHAKKSEQAYEEEVGAGDATA